MPSTEENLKSRFPDLKFVKLPPAEEPFFNYPGFAPGTSTILPEGHVKSPGRRPFPKDVIFERDQAILLRDGVTIYTDIFRPISSDTVKVPALIPWSPYGKSGSGPLQYKDAGPYNCGINLDHTSGYEKFEAPDPAEWCGDRGYAIVSVDIRGTAKSEGNIHWWGTQEAEDIYDAISWVVAQPWSSGAVSMIGNSWLAVSQINFASKLRHPALKALAPMEAQNDPYRHLIARGGHPSHKSFMKVILDSFAGPGSVEDLAGMVKDHPLFDDYWESKYIQVENIDIPLYLVGSYSSLFHGQGSFHTFRAARTEHKWLRVHPYQEWYDLYRPEISNDLQRFFDHFLKNIQNGWVRDTPPVRLSLLGFDGSPAKTVIERAEYEYPLARQRLVKYYLDASNNQLVNEKPSLEAQASHEGHSLTAHSAFALRFDSHVEIAGYSKVILWMSCNQKDDLDVAVQIRKLDISGQLLEHLNYPCPVPSAEVPNTNVVKTLGPEGFLRASHAISRDEERCQNSGQEVFYAHDRREPIEPGAIVPLEITLWPMGMVFEKGEGLMLKISGHGSSYPEFEAITPNEPDDENEGIHIIYTGGAHHSCLILPFI
ncbi:hypothetical protein LTR84_005816 [Exophiala bonariae]|uniref:Xaa-Pro dipeptidyl-peptidase C-terminal domain-containing protein n=1 Tax=Exophiala bonariae TaxID=1690606 RepID=A0AAV9N619_9EURO|nr:hypothetical protein LTR84_005816 [Exophiala bonariae]